MLGLMVAFSMLLLLRIMKLPMLVQMTNQPLTALP